MSRRRISLIALGIVVALVIAAVVAAGFIFRPLLLTGTGYAAHNACAIGFLTDRDDPESDLPPNPLVPYLRTSTDDAAGTVSASVLGVAFEQTAYVSEHGCTLGVRAAGSQSTQPPPSPSGDDGPEGIRLPEATDTPAAVSSALDEAAGHEGTRGLVVVHRGEILGERYADGFDRDTRQLGWSMTKSVTAALVGRAQLEYPDADLDPQRTGLRPQWNDEREQISLDDLLRMTSGLEWDEEYDLGTPVTQMLYQEPDMGAYAAGRPSVHEPGAVRQYSSGTTNIVCDLLHDETGLGPEMADELLFEELGMHSAVLEADASGGSVCSSYLWATPRDWAKFGQFALDDGVVHSPDGPDGPREPGASDAPEGPEDRRLLPEGWMDYSTEVVPADGEPEPYGAHWWVNTAADDDAGPARFPDMPADSFWASGHDGQYLVVVPSADLVVVRTGFSPGGSVDSLGVDALVSEVVGAVS